MSSDASRHSDAIDRHEEHPNMVRTAGTSDSVTQPVTSVEEALLKLKSVKQRKPSKHLSKHSKKPHVKKTNETRRPRNEANRKNLPGPGPIGPVLTRSRSNVFTARARTGLRNAFF